MTTKYYVPSIDEKDITKYQVDGISYILHSYYNTNNRHIQKDQMKDMLIFLDILRVKVSNKIKQLQKGGY